MYENLYWGATNSNVDADPNPRLEAHIAATRCGAKVRVLLDVYFDNQDLTSPRSNLRSVAYLTAVAYVEGLDLQARHRNPTGQGINNKMVLAQIGGRGWAIAGSLNGDEVSTKLNREMALLVGSDEVYSYLADVFWYDWDVTPLSEGDSPRARTISQCTCGFVQSMQTNAGVLIGWRQLERIPD